MPIDIKELRKRFTSEEQDKLVAVALVAGASSLKFYGDLKPGVCVPKNMSDSWKLCNATAAAMDYVTKDIIRKRTEDSLCVELLEEARSISDFYDARAKRWDEEGPTPKELAEGTTQGGAGGRKRTANGNFVKSGDFKW